MLMHRFFIGCKNLLEMYKKYPQMTIDRIVKIYYNDDE